LLATFVLFILDKSGGLGAIYRVAEPVVKRFLGLPVETAGIFIVGFFRRDYGAAGLFELWSNGILEGNDIVVALVVMSLFMPCLATLIVTIKELGIKYAFAIFLFVIGVSILSGGLLNIILSGFGVRL
jgi:ferrous iron transport protein B